MMKTAAGLVLCLVLKTSSLVRRLHFSGPGLLSEHVIRSTPLAHPSGRFRLLQLHGNVADVQ